jgi:hypothetical protein
MDEDLRREERLILDWLCDRNSIQRDIRTTAAGKDEVSETDVSGGLVALIRLLDSERPIDRKIRLALAQALDPTGTSLLHLKKRLRRRPGRPAKADTVRSAADVVFHGKHVVEARDKIKKRRPIPVAGTSQKPVKESEVNAELAISHAENIRRAKAHKQLFSNKK